jgi:hypothetical protein
MGFMRCRQQKRSIKACVDFLGSNGRVRFLAKLIVQTKSGHPLGTGRKVGCIISGFRLLLYEYEAISILRLQ